MHANILRDWRRDLEYTKPDCEYSQAYWDIIPAHRRMTELDTCLTTENATRSGRYYAADYIARHLGLFD